VAQLDLDESAIRDAARRAGLPDGPVRYDEVTESTNAAAVELARSGAPEWTIVAAGHQTAGRGRLGRTWESRPGSSLLFSIVLRPGLPPEVAQLIPLLAGAAMVSACENVGAAGVRCKWPNDLLLDDRKVGGILSEAAVHDGGIEYVVLGVGVNLGAAPEDVEGAGALGDAPAGDLLAAFLAELRGGYENGGEGTFAARVVERYRACCGTIGRRVRATTTAGVVVEGTAVDVDDAGALVVETAAGRETVGFGEVHHLR
jgi:BirA family biotin operon repressor/biotin-[acetyl-CoA-carboxylase] ligase